MYDSVMEIIETVWPDESSRIADRISPRSTDRTMNSEKDRLFSEQMLLLNLIRDIFPRSSTNTPLNVVVRGEIEKLRLALEFYQRIGEQGNEVALIDDGGNIARSALGSHTSNEEKPDAYMHKRFVDWLRTQPEWISVWGFILTFNTTGFLFGYLVFD